MSAGASLDQPDSPATGVRPETSRLQDILSQLARRHAWRLVVLFGSAARGEAARDLDLAVLPAAVSSLLTQGAWLAELKERLAPWAVDLLVVGDETSPVARFEVFRQGRCLFEAEPGLFSREQDRAFFLYADSEPIRRQMREVLHARTQP
ncbi:MAG: nucleotidyltransferase domain-containing protein [Chromatiaceae bacterium]|jgi:predicted nucleotidyltransferase|nr:nucleotidyltransferase domain-containing protein [Chromatiaceae bacterium]